MPSEHAAQLYDIACDLLEETMAGTIPPERHGFFEAISRRLNRIARHLDDKTPLDEDLTYLEDMNDVAQMLADEALIDADRAQRLERAKQKAIALHLPPCRNAPSPS
jgi:hypothetical protein